MPRTIGAERIALARAALAEYRAQERVGCDEATWLALRLGCSPHEGARLLRAVERRRPYSTRHTARANPRRYLLSGIPPTLWAEVRTRARREPIAVRSLILDLLKAWVEARRHTPESPV
jgi:hypothetical protein